MHLVSEAGGAVTTVAGFDVQTKPIPDTPFDTVLVAAFAGTELVAPKSIAFLQGAAQSARRVGSFCTGAFVLAQAGILNDRRATTHWRNAGELQARFPSLRVVTDRLFVNDGRVWTSAGMMASVDLALALVEEDLGADTARVVARRMLIERRRQGHQPQMSSLLELEPRSDRLHAVLDFARRHLGETLTVQRLAEVARLSPRQLSRAFQAEFGQPPAKVIERLRTEAARALVVGGRHSFENIAADVGFADRERMRRSFVRIYGRAPQTMRRSVRGPAAGPNRTPPL